MSPAAWRALGRLPAWLERRGLGLARAAAARPRRTLRIWALVSLLPLPGLLFLRLDTDGQTLVPRADPAVLADRAVRERFALRDPLIVFLRAPTPAGLFDPAFLRRVEAVTAAARALPGVEAAGVMSLATEKRDRLTPGSHQSFGTFLEPFPETAGELAALRRDLAGEAAAIYRGTLVAAEGRGAAVFVPVEPGVDRRALYRRLEEEVERAAGASGATGGAVIVGAPAAEALLGDHVLADLALLIPLAVLLIAAVLGWGMRSPAAVLLALGKVGLTLAWTLAVLALLGVPVYLTTAVLPVILATLCLADEIHLLLAWQRLRAAGAEPAAALDRTLAELVRPVVLATAATVAGFLSLAFSPLAPVRALGGGAALGTAYSLAFSLVATPALFTLLGDRLRSRREAGQSRGNAALLAPFRLAIRHPRWTLAGIAAVTLAATLGLIRLSVQDSWIDSFPRQSQFRRATDEVNLSLWGTHLLQVHLRFPADRRPPALVDPAVVARLGRFERFLAGEPGVGGALGLHRHLTALAWFWETSERPQELLEDGRELRRLMNRYELSPGWERRRQVVTDDFSETLTTVFLENANFRETRQLMARITAYHRRELAPLGATLGFAGDVAVSQATIPAVVRTQVVSLPLALLGVFAAVAALYGSWRLALAALLPMAVSTLWLGGLLGAAGIPLGVATSMFFPLALGLGVDSQSVHFLERFLERRRQGGRGAGLVLAVLEEVGPAVVVNTVTVAAGFGILAFSSLPANARLGLLIALALVLGAAGTLGGLGALLAWGDERREAGTHGSVPL